MPLRGGSGTWRTTRPGHRPSASTRTHGLLLRRMPARPGRSREPSGTRLVPLGSRDLPGRAGPSYWLPSAGCSSPALRRPAQLYLRWNFSTRPVVSTYFILPVKNGWHAEQISTVMFLRVLRVVNLLPQPHVTVHSSYLGWMPSFMTLSLSIFVVWRAFSGTLYSRNDLLREQAVMGQAAGLPCHEQASSLLQGDCPA